MTQYQFKGGMVNSFMQPFIYCHADDAIWRTAIPLNVPMAKKLMAVRPARRSFKLPGIIDSILVELPAGSLVKDFDVLFHPDYQIDVLQLLISAWRKKPFSILWPGDCVNGKLTYSQAGYPDFKQYDIEKYDVTCIV